MGDLRISPGPVLLLTKSVKATSFYQTGNGCGSFHLTPVLPCFHIFSPFLLRLSLWFSCLCLQRGPDSAWNGRCGKLLLSRLPAAENIIKIVGSVGRGLDFGSKGCWFKTPGSLSCVGCLVLFQPRNIDPDKAK